MKSSTSTLGTFDGNINTKYVGDIDIKVATISSLNQTEV
jgi:hypothetical protein